MKRLCKSLRKRWAEWTWVDGYNVRRYNGLRWLLCCRNFVDRQIGGFDGFEQRQMRYLLDAMQKGCDAFLDIGANFGLYSLQVAKSGLAKEVHAFEPDARNAAQLAGNLYLNQMTSQVHVHPVAVSDTAGRIAFELHPETSTGTTRVASSSEGNAFLEAVRLEDFLDWKGRTLFIKMDIEGHELAALKGARALLSNNRCFLQVEVFPENEQQVTAYLKSLGFAIECQIDRDFYFNRPDVGSWRS